MRSFFPVWVVFTLAFLVPQRSAFGDEPPLIPTDPQIRDDGAIIFQVSGGFRSSQTAAKESALQAAQQQMRWWLGQQESPVRHAPTIETIRRKLITQEDVRKIETDNGEPMYKITITVFLNPSIVRELRGTDRVVSCAWWLGGVMFVLSLIALVLRLDEWTKGYLTRWLIVGAAGVGLAIALLLLWAK